MTIPLHIEVAICTYRRPGVVDTLASVARQKLPEGGTFAILVVDNDAGPSAESRIRGYAHQSGMAVRYIHAPASNISVARNAALDAARARFLVFIDDDEIAEPGWLAALAAAREASGADVVLGPVRAVYGADAPRWIRALDTHSARPVAKRGTIRTGYSCNVLLDLECSAFSDLRFDPALGRSGGEDTAFFTRAFRRGARFAEAPDARVSETVPRERARFSWLARRRFRSGQTHGRLLGETVRGAAVVREAALAVLKVGYCAAAAILFLPLPERRNAAALRGCLHAGTLAGLLGARPITLYGDTAPGVSQ